ncbi:MAG: GNAT family N-acyltransferase [Planctomycetota bacterium]
MSSLDLSSHSEDAARLLPGQDFVPALDDKAGRYRLRFARTEDDLEAVQRLRFEVFNLELGEGLPESFDTGRDVDRFDRQCQHLMVEELATGDTVGTYRLQNAECARKGEGFYSAGEFELESLPEEVIANSVELGRACVAKDHRDRRALFLLWRGLVAYVNWNEKRYFFGCSSLTSQEVAEGRRAYAQLDAIGALHPEWRVLPRAEFSCGEPQKSDAELPEVSIPPLFSIYLRYGARILGPPAIDRQFKTIDYLTMIDMQSVDARAILTMSAGRS